MFLVLWVIRHNEWTNIDLIRYYTMKLTKLERESGTSEKLITFISDCAGHYLRYAIEPPKLVKTSLGVIT